MGFILQFNKIFPRYDIGFQMDRSKGLFQGIVAKLIVFCFCFFNLLNFTWKT